MFNKIQIVRINTTLYINKPKAHNTRNTTTETEVNISRFGLRQSFNLLIEVLVDLLAIPVTSTKLDIHVFIFVRKFSSHI